MSSDTASRTFQITSNDASLDSKKHDRMSRVQVGGNDGGKLIMHMGDEEGLEGGNLRNTEK